MNQPVKRLSDQRPAAQLGRLGIVSMEDSMSPLLRFSRFLTLLALLSALVVTGVTPVAAAAPAVSATPTTVPFSETPGQAGTTHVTVAADAGTAYSACVSDNGTKKLVTTVPNGGPTAFDAPFIQAGTYLFFASSSADCNNQVGTPVTVQRAGPEWQGGRRRLHLHAEGRFHHLRQSAVPDPRQALHHERQRGAEAGQPATRPGPARLRGAAR